MPPKVPSDPGGFGLDGDQGQASDPLQQNSLPGDNLGSLPPLFSSDEGVTFQSPAAPLAEAGGSANSQSAPSVTGNTSAFVINVTYEASAANAPAAFKTAVAS